MFYDRFVKLCKAKGMSPAAVAKDIGLSNSSTTTWKRGSIPKGDTLQKLADYFGVSVDHLLGKDKEIVHTSTYNDGGITKTLIRTKDGKEYYELEFDEEKLSIGEIEILLNVFTKLSEKYNVSELLTDLAEAAAKAAVSASQQLPQSAPASLEGKGTTPGPEGSDPPDSGEE